MSVASELAKLETNRSNIVSAINTKGGSLATSAGLSACPAAILAIQTGIDTSDATAVASDIVKGKTAYADGSKVTGTLTVSTYYSGTTAPSSSLGSNGDFYLLIES